MVKLGKSTFGLNIHLCYATKLGRVACIAVMNVNNVRVLMNGDGKFGARVRYYEVKCKKPHEIVFGSHNIEYPEHQKSL